MACTRLHSVEQRVARWLLPCWNHAGADADTFPMLGEGTPVRDVDSRNNAAMAAADRWRVFEAAAREDYRTTEDEYGGLQS